MTRGQLPHHLEAEQAVLGAIFLQPQIFSSIAEKLTAQDFYAPKHQNIFQAMVSLDTTGEPIDLITVTTRLKNDGRLDESGGAGYLTGLLETVPTIAHVEHHAQLVAEASTRRRIVEAAQDIAKEGVENAGPLATFVDFSESRFFDVTSQRSTRAFTPLKSILKANMERIDRLYNNKQSLTGVASGFTEIDKMTSGFQPSDLILLAARPSMGKTSLVMNIVANVGMRKEGGVAVFSLEMSNESLGLRLLSSLAKVDSRRVRNGQLFESDWPKIMRAIGLLSEAPIFIDETPNISVMEMRSACRRLAARQKLDLVVVDYIQLMRGSSARSENREKEISEISRGLKSLAKELHVPIIGLSQLSRSVEGRPDKRPMPSDLRESGSLEQDADLVAFIYRDEVYNKDTDRKGVAEVIVAKHRNGPTGTAYLTWLDKYTTFENFAGATQSSSSEIFQGPPGGPPPSSSEF